MLRGQGDVYIAAHKSDCPCSGTASQHRPCLQPLTSEGLRVITGLVSNHSPQRNRVQAQALSPTTHLRGTASHHRPCLQPLTSEGPRVITGLVSNHSPQRNDARPVPIPGSCRGPKLRDGEEQRVGSDAALWPGSLLSGVCGEYLGE